MKNSLIWASILPMLLAASCADGDGVDNHAEKSDVVADETDDGHAGDHGGEGDAASRLEEMTDEERQALNTTPIPVGVYPQPPSPNYGPEHGSITFLDTDPGETIGGILTMRPAVDENGAPIDAAEEGITQYMIHWGLEVGNPGIDDDEGAGDLGGDCMGFRDTGHVVKMDAAEAGDEMRWELPPGTIVPEGAVYFVGHTLYGNLHNLAKCTQTPIENLVE